MADNANVNEANKANANANDNANANANAANNNINNNDVIVTDVDDVGRRPFPEPFQKENVTFMRLLKRLKNQPEYRGFRTPSIEDFIDRFPVYVGYEEESFHRAYNAVKRWFRQCK